MNRKPISPELHGIIDYAFATTLFLAPSLLGLNKKAKCEYYTLGAAAFGYSALTDYPMGLKPVISYNTHRMLDYATITTFAATTACKVINKEKRTLVFHLSMMALAAVTVMLTDWNKD